MTVAAFVGVQPVSQAEDVPLMAYVATPDEPFFFVFAGVNPGLLEVTGIDHASIEDPDVANGITTGFVECATNPEPCSGFLTLEV